MKSKILLFFILLLAIGCQKEDDIFTNEDETLILNESEITDTEEVPVGDEMIIGEKLENPYSIENLNKARLALDKKLGRTSEALVATHLYIKFKPTTESHCQTLLNIDEAGTMTLHAYPLDSKILQEGATPLAKSITNPGLNELYAVVPIGGTIPNVPYEILSRIIPEPQSESVEATSLLLTGNGDELAPKMTIDKIAQISKDKATKSKSAKGIFGLQIFGSKWTPSGNILVYDTRLRSNVIKFSSKLLIHMLYNVSS